MYSGPFPVVLFYSLKFEETETWIWDRSTLSLMRHSYIGLDTGLHKEVAKRTRLRWFYVMIIKGVNRSIQICTCKTVGLNIYLFSLSNIYYGYNTATI